MDSREAAFEQMLSTVQEQYRDTVVKMERLKAEGKIKSATFRQLLGDKMMYQTMLSMYRSYGLLDDESE